CVVGAHW
nr:immunoglobulin heavy chain junction region [Macaca mulatta]MOV59186.1 immunoglobulin heavy chain junction region [Macaca mulatta]